MVEDPSFVVPVTTEPYFSPNTESPRPQGIRVEIFSGDPSDLFFSVSGRALAKDLK